MENKYYTPNISDLFIGYECELLSDTGEWTKTHFPSIFFEKLTSWIELGKIRTPYITKEQMETELPGWEYKRSVSHWFYNNKFHDIKNDNVVTGYHVRKMRLHMYEKHHLYKNFFPTLKVEFNFAANGENEWEMMYEGICPSMNEFRKIMKLLGI